MSILELGALGEFIGSIGVIASLIYLAVQIRQNSVSSKAQAVQSASDIMINLSLELADESWTELINRASDHFDALPPGERGRIGWLWFAVMRGTETLYRHYLEGNVDEQTWETYATAVQHNARMSGFRRWWRSVSGTYTFARDFDDFVTDIVDKAEVSGEKYEWFGGETVP